MNGSKVVGPVVVAGVLSRLVRFHPNERVVVSSIHVCERGGVILNFSERIQLNRLPSVTLLADAKPQGCSVVDSSGGTASSLVLACGTLVGARTLTVGLGSGPVSVSQKAALKLSHSFTLETLVPWGDGCGRYRPDDPQH